MAKTHTRKVMKRGRCQAANADSCSRSTGATSPNGFTARSLIFKAVCKNRNKNINSYQMYKLNLLLFWRFKKLKRQLTGSETLKCRNCNRAVRIGNSGEGGLRRSIEQKICANIVECFGHESLRSCSLEHCSDATTCLGSLANFTSRRVADVDQNFAR